jgi:TolA-binding protein
MLGEGKMFASDNETLKKDLKNLSMVASITEYQKEIQKLKEKIETLEEKIEMKNEIIKLLKENKT